MTDWTFQDDYGGRYPALANTALSVLAFSDHALVGSAFHGTLDVAASGVALATLGTLAEVTAIPVAGTVTESNGTLTVSFTSTGDSMRAGLASNLPLVGELVTDASLVVAVATDSTDTDDTIPDETFDVVVTVTFASGETAKLRSAVPMHGGTFAVSGAFQGVKLELSDLDFLFGGSAEGAFPSSELGPFFADAPPLQLLDVLLHVYMVPSPLSVAVSSASVSIGITGIALYEQALYLDPLAVRALISPPFTAPSVTWWLEGCLALCNYTTPGAYQTPDVTFDVEMGLSDFSFKARLNNAADVPLETLVKDLAGADADPGLSPTLELANFEIKGQADKTSGALTSFSAMIAMKGDVPLFGVELTGAGLMLSYVK
jgi:hypothetical protein